MPRLWLSYLTLLTHPSCPAPLSYTHTRHTFDRALRTLSHSLHERIWKPYLRWSEHVAGGETCIRVWRRYLTVDPSLTAHYVQFLINESESDAKDDDIEEGAEALSQDEDEDEEEEEEEEGEEGEKKEENGDVGTKQKTSRAQQKHPHKALIAAKLLLGLVRKARKGKYKSPDGKSPYQLLIDFMELCEKFPHQIGISLKQATKRRQKQAENMSKDNKTNSLPNGQTETQKLDDASAPFGGLIRIVGPPVSTSHKKTAFERRPKVSEEAEAYDPDVDPANPSRLDIDRITELEGLSIYKDQLGLIYTNLATYWIKRTEFEKAKEVFEDGIARVLTIRDFTTIFDAYAEFSEQYISTLMESIGEDGDEDQNEQEEELDTKMREFEELMDRRPFLVNDVLLRRNPNDVQEWEKRVVLHGNEDEKVVETYLKAIETINPKKATSNFHQLFVNFAKWYEETGASDQDDSAPDLKNARQVFERAVNVNFQRVDDLAEIWIEWAEMEKLFGSSEGD
ncbi:expressed protein [Phakopsora pachyrhizi]|uniref:Pre-mRNA-splicing factor SYF1 n=1 Tax=Phakopsora pachyrhizi TaxID=170000 RepID=A0AAV0AKA7_PHAPC|nr:expressed protein [Phakopsora pachyrhizi]